MKNSILKVNYIEINPINFCGIYCYYCLITNKFYIGSAEVFSRRKADHLLRLRKNIHINPHLQSAYNKYGIENFIWLKLEDVQDLSVLLDKEQEYLDLYKPYDRAIGYNISSVAGRPPSVKGLKKSKEFCEKLRKLKTGVKYSDETKAKQRVKKLGIKLSKEHSENISKALKMSGHKPGEKALKAVSEANSKEYIFLSPDGNFTKIINLMKFCKENKLNRNSMSLVSRGIYGKKNCYKGWRNILEMEVCV